MNSDNSRARETAGLGVVVAWLKAAGGLENGIPSPVDAHPDEKPLEFRCRYPKPDHGVLETGCSSGRNLHYVQTRRSPS
jgi:hypothetical protein